MFGSHVLDVVIGLIFIFMSVSLATTAITEAIASTLKLRHRTLRSGVQALLNDKDFTGLALQIYNEALVNPLSSGLAKSAATVSTIPAYIQSTRFAESLVRVVSAGEKEGSLSEAVNAIQDQQLREALSALLQKARGSQEEFERQIAKWFDDTMDRVSGWYKRKTQLIGFLVALFISIIFNADAIHAGASLFQATNLQAQLASNDMPTAAQAAKTLSTMSLIGWENQPDLLAAGIPTIAMTLAGWLMVAAASLLGAPFWFDTLQRIARISGTGPAQRTSEEPSKTPPD
ncbi:hypothetical protein AMC82_PC00027 (plasmid) [Rhizobium phaseoli]|uniref:hypothetical protein n=1 Tax=Rhizobium phaseoli TaxID=396 RepID=UPI0007EA1414|nr:hypothetical protein [Rhizobium phaseoli]ANL68591.1 hypothetical protein AMC84_PC00027 [Rhizobium phaseoli]ANL81400.1 hypothetical protein AMC82_PC00027 [Rhizobium phaseoli]